MIIVSYVPFNYSSWQLNLETSPTTQELNDLLDPVRRSICCRSNEESHRVSPITKEDLDYLKDNLSIKDDKQAMKSSIVKFLEFEMTSKES